MSIDITSTRREGFVQKIGRLTLESVRGVGDTALFFANMLSWLCRRLPRRGVLLQCMYQVGVQSLPVVVITGAFIGMVISAQSYAQFKMMHFETNLGAVINTSLVKELGPVLAATMLAGRIGSAMAAELGTMRITEQMDALQALGANPVHYLAVPRLVACVLLIPALTAMADLAGVVGGWAFSTQVLMINNRHYWNHTESFLGSYELLSGIVKSIFFGAAIAVVACHRGFRCSAGAEGVGKAATEAFVYSFVAILVLDLILVLAVNALYMMLWPV